MWFTDYATFKCQLVYIHELGKLKVCELLDFNIVFLTRFTSGVYIHLYKEG